MKEELSMELIKEFSKEERMSFFDEPKGMNEADLLMNRLESKADASSRASKHGKCTHGWRQRISPKGGDIREDDIQTCLHCGIVKTRIELDNDANDIFLEYE